MKCQDILGNGLMHFHVDCRCIQSSGILKHSVLFFCLCFDPAPVKGFLTCAVFHLFASIFFHVIWDCPLFFWEMPVEYDVILLFVISRVGVSSFTWNDLVLSWNTLCC